MASAIDSTKPTDSALYAGDLRSNLEIAKDEITSLQATVAAKIGALAADLSPDLGGNLNVSGHKITTLVSNGDVVLEPNGAGMIDLNAEDVLIGESLRHKGDFDTQIEFTIGVIQLRIAGSERISVSALGMRLGGSGARVTTISNDATMASNSATALATQQSIKSYVDANAGISSLSADPSPGLSAPLNGGGNPIVNYTQPKVGSVSGTLTQASHGGRPCHITGSTVVPIADGFVAELRNKSGTAKTITPASGSLIHEGATKASISLPNNRAVVVAGDGTDVWVYGALA